MLTLMIEMTYGFEKTKVQPYEALRSQGCDRRAYMDVFTACLMRLIPTLFADKILLEVEISTQ